MLDVIASRVYGLVNAKDARVVWTSGWLYVVRSPTDIIAFECSKPTKHGGTYKAKLAEGTITFLPPGCGSCRRRVQASAIGQMSVTQIVSAVESVDA